MLIIWLDLAKNTQKAQHLLGNRRVPVWQICSGNSIWKPAVGKVQATSSVLKLAAYMYCRDPGSESDGVDPGSHKFLKTIQL